jgi:HlyD family secretion protein
MSEAPSRRNSAAHRLAGSLLGAVAVLGGCSLAPKDAGLLSRYTVQDGPLDITITVDGELNSLHPSPVVAETNGKILFIIPQGTEVKKGDKLLELENKDLAGSIAIETDDIAADVRDLANAQLELKLKQLEADKEINDTQTALVAAQMADDALVKGQAPLDVEDKEMALEKAVSEMTDAQEKYSRMPKLLEKGFITLSEERLAELDLHEKTLAVEHQKRQIELYNLYQFPTAKDKVDADVQTAKLAQARIKDQTATELVQKQADIDKIQAHMADAQRKLQAFQEQEAGLTVTAPNAGIVTYGAPDQRFYVNDNQRYEVGGEVYQQQCLMCIPDLTAMQVTVPINESDIAKLKVGMATSSEIKGLNGGRIDGAITSIATAASQMWGQYGTVFQCKSSLNAAKDVVFRPGMSVRTEIFVKHFDRVRHIPVEMVYSRGNDHYCWLRETDGTLVYREVGLGDANDAQVVITKGLADGDEVVLPEIEPALPPAAPAAAADAADATAPDASANHAPPPHAPMTPAESAH